MRLCGGIRSCCVKRAIILHMTKREITSPVTGGRTRKVQSIATNDILVSYDKAGLLEVARPYVEKAKKVEIRECEDTGYRYYYPFNIFGDDKFYDQLQKGKKHYYHQRWEFGPAMDIVKENDKVLEVGCGHGDFLAGIVDKTEHALGLELSKKAIKAAKSRGLNVRGETIQSHAKANEGKYDVVCMFQVLEHIWEVEDFLTACIKALKPGGVLIIGVPNNNPYLFKRDILHALNLPPHHSGLWNKKSLHALAGVFPLKPIKIQTEPLHETELYWKVQKQHWQESAPLLYKIVDSLPVSFNSIRNSLLTRLCQGRNVVAMYEKTDKS